MNSVVSILFELFTSFFVKLNLNILIKIENIEKLNLDGIASSIEIYINHREAFGNMVITLLLTFIYFG